MANNLKIVDLLRWYTDKEHPITQENLRKIRGANEAMGYKGTFRRHLYEIADTYNVNENGDLLKENEWKIVFPGYSQSKKKGDNGSIQNGKIYYQHEIGYKELDLILSKIDSSDELWPEKKKSLKNKLIKLLGSIYYSEREVDIFNFVKSNDMLEHNMQFIRNAISNKKMIEFQMTYLNAFGKREKRNGTYMVSPYKIIVYQGNYWLLGNQRLGKNVFKGIKKIKYGKYNEYFRIDKIDNLKIAKEVKEKEAHYFLNTNSRIDKWNRSVCFECNGNIESAEEIKFKILWKCFEEVEKYDYDFLRDVFGEAYKVECENVEESIVSVNASVYFFVNWAMGYIDKIQVLEDTKAGISVRKKVCKKLKFGFENYKV